VANELTLRASVDLVDAATARRATSGARSTLTGGRPWLGSSRLNGSATSGSIATAEEVLGGGLEAGLGVAGNLDGSLGDVSNGLLR
jgi:hypothetical protein